MMHQNLPFISSPPESPPSDSPLAAYAYDGMPSAASVLVLEPNDVRNAVFRHPVTGRTAYVVCTDERGDRTDVRLAGSDARDSSPVLASIHRKAFSPSVTLKGTRIPLQRWLRTTMGSAFGVTFDARGKSYEWRTNALGNLTLFEANGKLPLAWFVSPRNRSTTPGSRAYLALEKEAESIRDDIIASFIVVEEALRMIQRKVAAY